MRVAFMGTPEFAVPILDALVREHEVVAVYTRPDAAAGRGRRIVESPVKVRAVESGLHVEQPVTLRDETAAATLSALGPDVVVVAAYGLILPQAVLDVPALGCVNVHASLLPRWRGAAPVQRAILAGDEITGVSIMRMEAGLDTGPYCVVRETSVDEKTAFTLTGELASLGADALLEALSAIAGGTVVWTQQDPDLATYAEKLTAADVSLDPTLTVSSALRRVRASGPSAPCRIELAGRRVVVLEAGAVDGGLAAGAVSAGKHLEIGLADGSVRLTRIVPEGRSAMDGAAFARGARLAPDAVWNAL